MPTRSGTGSHSRNSSSGRPAELGFDDAGGELGAHGRCVGLELGERLPDVGRHAGVEVAGHLAQLHHRPLHVPERLGDLGRGLHLELGVERLAPFGIGEHPPGSVHGVVAAGLAAHASHLASSGPAGR